MADNTRPEALRLANVCSNLTRYSMDAHLIAAELRRQHARIAELEAQLSSSGFTAADGACGGWRVSAICASYTRGANMNNTQPEALRLAKLLTADEWPGNMTLVSYARECVAELRRQHARIAELEAQLSSSGFTAADMATAAAQGFRDGANSVAASAGSEPVAIYHGRCVIDCGAHGHLDMELLKMIPAGSKLYTHPSPPEGLVGGWMPIETAS